MKKSTIFALVVGVFVLAAASIVYRNFTHGITESVSNMEKPEGAPKCYVALTGVDVTQKQGDAGKVLLALQEHYKDKDGVVYITFEDYDKDYYYLTDESNGYEWKIDRATLSKIEKW